MRIQHNIMAMNAYRNYNNNTSALSKNLEKLSSGYKINRAGDDAAGLAISEKMRAQITGLDKAQDNAKDGISLVQTAEGALTEVHDMLNRMYELAEQSANGTYDDKDREQLEKEVNQLKTEINRISDSANFNGIKLLNGNLAGASAAFTQGSATSKASLAITISGKGEDLIGGNIQIGNVTISVEENAAGTTGVSYSGGVLKVDKSSSATDIATAIATAFNSIQFKDKDGELVTMAAASANAGTITLAASANGEIKVSSLPGFSVNSGLQLQIGDTSDSYNQMKVGINNIDVASLFLNATSVSTQEKAAEAVDYIQNAINMISDVRGTLGATQNRLDHTINNLSVMQENIQDAESTIRDTDVADEMMAYTKNNILIQSAQAMLAQANQVPQGVLQLLQ